MSDILFEHSFSDQNEVEVLLNQIIDLSLQENPDPAYVALAHYVPLGMEYLRDLIIPTRLEQAIEWATSDIRDPDKQVHFKLILQTVSQRTVYEFRIDAPPLFFRAFFYIYNESVNRQYKIMTRAFIKDQKNPPIQQEAIQETALRANVFARDPIKNLRKLKLHNEK
ncbi:hypothetical protein H8B09_24325 [Paenibacillus sp. PR3]|uniref:Uncharacterized protein n=1 Tax=Paenibacillus terricola TaxID=2763503 RepID=A0ABR8N216_9BACL|nr:hypothetical protein [Paenibacillus terricola]MBD3921910.1 hypothetical protein [Paenibacillus terricola]